jgi:hypothetical protein
VSTCRTQQKGFGFQPLGEQPATSQAARGRARPPCRHFKNRSCSRPNCVVQTLTLGRWLWVTWIPHRGRGGQRRLEQAGGARGLMTHAPWLAQSRAFTAAAKVVVTGPAFAEPEVLFGDLTVLGSCFRYDLFPDPPGAQVTNPTH